MSNSVSTVIFFLVCWAAVHSIPIDNGLTGDPEVECGSTSISISFNANNAFEGRVFVKNHFSTPGCVAPATGSGTLASLTVPFDSCSVKRERSATPRGVFVSTTVIISFHPTFITKVDRAFRVQCFYMEADKTVSQEIEVSRILTTALATMNVPMPVCKYDILDGGPTGSPVQFVTIGQQVYHKWTCDTDTTDAFCMVVYDCKVDDGSGDTIQLLNNDGCSLDKHLLNNLEYPADLMGGQEAHVFKYADRPNLYFNCQIRITVKDPGVPCARPECSEPARGKRSALFGDRREIAGETIVDVSTEHAILVADLDMNASDLPSYLLHPDGGVASAQIPVQNPCVRSAVGSVLVAVAVLLAVAVIVVGVRLHSRKHCHLPHRFCPLFG